LLLRDITRQTPQVLAAVKTIVSHTPDVIVLQGIDRDDHAYAAKSLSELLAQHGLALPHVYMPPSNTGLPTGLDIDGDGRANGPRDAQGYGRFRGQGSIAVLSRWQIGTDRVQSFHDLLWRDVTTSAILTNLLPESALPIQRLASISLAAIPIELEAADIWILTHHATPPVFDGPEDRNGHRNSAENRFWPEILAREDVSNIGEFHIIAAQLNLDPEKGEGQKQAVVDILENPLLQDAFQDWPAEDRHTATFQNAGRLRVSYLLPSIKLEVQGCGMSKDIAITDTNQQSRHRLLWVDVEIPGQDVTFLPQ